MQDDARELLDELKYIPKKIQLLKEDIEATRKSLIKSPTYSDTRVKGGNPYSQEDKFVSIIDTTDYNKQLISELLDRKGEILQILNKLDHLEYLILFTLYCNDLTNDEAMDKLDIRNRNKFFKLKKQAIEHLQLILEREC
ncbi:hypothetical protein SPSF3K_00079 [Streptococcus parauberis]|uniref:DUF1492 domain-containing protein n=1 Tax=Streptococcus parauberis KRS-02083 TaxID=1207545 RepID=A0ABN0IP42_9STRE|nr:DUF1492 domain-containing protein [Streptococcus parauberis]QBX09818.1 hypothetical protein JavanS390_0007 [Streptococcus satellite phage Javan390]QBX09862.1 hypothetical protein JavanS395_0007 [Streptococcus satellite phage Javan395]AUT04821.1 hypothetical protein SPSF3K_00079 [Streptococcus parauberis]EMG24569.1 hypothetical protein SPJ1_2090 [Streptococcus parauberis KRS-02083]UWV10292.1 DUF1492 domain-containing protein [Streptococcus parauberis]